MMIRAMHLSRLSAPFLALVCLFAQAQSPEKPAATQPAAASPAATQPAAITSSCSATASEKKLAGAAKNSFMKKCEREATATCETAATDRKLAGAAKNSFLKKCVKDAVGA
jgi:hypothetical protein